MSKKESLRLHYLDGLRALASVYVVLFHAGACFTGSGGAPLPGFARLGLKAVSFGHDAVAVFIVLSGYCLMLPVARADGELKRGLASYVRRRAWRILPPYFATLLVSLLLLALLPILETPTKTIWQDTHPAFDPGALLSHVFVVHNWFPHYAYRINGPLWSVATEWQIYFVFPFLLLPLWRRFGAVAAVAGGALVGAALVWLAPRAAHTACSWYIGLFALGMSAAGIGFASRATERNARERLPWGAITLGLLGAVALGITVFIKRWFVWIPLSDALVGATTASALVYLTRHASAHDGGSSAPKPLALRVLEARPLVFLGQFSYSLYLTHLPIVALCYFLLHRLELAAGREWLLLVLLSLPLSVIVAYPFYWVFERRFVGAPPALFGKREA